LQVPFQGIEPARPFGSVGLEPGVERSQWFGAEPVEPSLGVAADLDQAGVSQHLEVAGHPGLVHADLLDQLADGLFVVANGVEDPSPGGFGDHLEDGQVAGHGTIIRYAIYVCKQMYR
jgi:hypothetical protein